MSRRLRHLTTAALVTAGFTMSLTAAATAAGATPASAAPTAAAAGATHPKPCGRNAGAAQMSRSDAVARARTWIANTPYSQGDCYQNQYGDYRTDCSGMVAMAWGLGGNGDQWWTGNLDDVSTPIGFSALQPGDALLDARGTTNDHVALFVRWNDDAHTQPWVIQTTGSAGNTIEGVPENISWNAYVPIRYDHITGAGNQTAFQANTSMVFTRDDAGVASMPYGMKDGTSPAASGAQLAFQANTGLLFTRDSTGAVVNTGYGVRAGTSPAVSGGEVAFQANTGVLWLRNMTTGVMTNTGYGMRDGSSPAIAGSTGNWKVAFQANTGSLFTLDSQGRLTDTGYGMRDGTGPDIAALSQSRVKGAPVRYAIAFQANTGSLYTIDGAGTTIDTGYGMKAGTSPAVSAYGGAFTGGGSFAGSYQVAFQANDGFLYTRAGTSAAVRSVYGLKADTSPAIDGSAIAFQGNDGFLYTRAGASTAAVRAPYGMQARTSPAN